jgi:hypothetical protein
MRELFKNLTAMDGVKGVLLFLPSGELVYKEFSIGGRGSVSSQDWFALVKSMGEMQDADLVFQKGRIYSRRTGDGILVVVMGLIAPSAMIRLSCDIILRNFKIHRAPKSLKRFFRI